MYCIVLYENKMKLPDHIIMCDIKLFYRQINEGIIEF